MSFATELLAPATTYIQTTPIVVSGKVVIPQGCKKIEALLVGGGGGGSNCGGGLGGIGIFDIPLVGSVLDVIIGAGGLGQAAGSLAGTRGGLTTVSIYGTPYAVIGGGGGGAPLTNPITAIYSQQNGEFGGNGGGGYGSGSTASMAGAGGVAPQGSLLWWPAQGSQTVNPAAVVATEVFYTVFPLSVGLPARYCFDSVAYNKAPATEGSLGGGSGGCFETDTFKPFGAGNGGPGGGGYSSGPGGSLTAYSVWGIQFKSAGTGSGAGGGGILGAGGNGPSGAGGLGGGGGGGCNIGADGGPGGNGCAIFRFYF